MLADVLVDLLLTRCALKRNQRDLDGGLFMAVSHESIDEES
jgi:hypothetical protein